MKNTKLIALVAVLVVVTLVISIVVATSNDATTKNEVLETVTKYEDKIDALNKTIEQLNQGLIDANTALEQFKNAGVELENWNEATVALPAQLQALDDAYDAFVKAEQIYDEDDSEKVLVKFDEIYANYADVNYTAIFTDLKAAAARDLGRATSVAEMTTIVNNYKTSLNNVPTTLESFVATVEAIEANGVTLDDYDNIVLVPVIQAKVDADLYAEGQEKDLTDRITEINKTFKPLAVEQVVTLVNALPENVAHLAPSHEEALKAANDALTFALGLYEGDDSTLLLDKKNKATAYANAKADLALYNAQWTVVEAIVAAAETLNETLKEAFDEDVFTEEFGANIETLTYLNSLKALIDAWETTIVTDVEDEDYSEEIYNLVNRSVYEGYVADYEVEIADLRAAADAFIEAVAALEGTITPDSLDAIMAAQNLSKAAAGLKPADMMDTLCGYTDYTDDEGELVDVIGVQDSAIKLTALYNDYKWLVDTIEALEKAVADAVIKCAVEHKDADGKVVACDGKDACAKVGTVDYAVLANSDFDTEIVKILSYYNLDETVFDAEALAEYKVARIYDEVQAAKKNVADAHAAYANELFFTSYNNDIDAITANYTFAVELVCTCPDDSTDPCECNTYKMAIENDPIDVLAEQFDYAVLVEIFKATQQ